MCIAGQLNFVLSSIAIISYCNTKTIVIKRDNSDEENHLGSKKGKSSGSTTLSRLLEEPSAS
jgi:hypothetical protein